MGRGVYTPSDAETTIYLLSPIEDAYDYDDMLTDIANILRRRYPSFNVEQSPRWQDREGRIILTNCHARVVVAEYGGCVSISLVPYTCDRDVENDAFRRAWCGRIAKGFRQCLGIAYKGSTLERLGTFSNGETVYQRA